MQGGNPTHQLKPRGQSFKRGKSAPANRTPAAPSSQRLPTPVPSPELKPTAPMETQDVKKDKGDIMADDSDAKATEEMAKLDINKLPPDDKKSVEFLNAVNSAFRELFNMVCRGSRQLHVQALKAYVKNGGGDDGRGFVVFPIRDLTKFLATGEGHEQTKYITRKSAELQEAAAKKNKNMPQVAVSQELKDLLEKYDPQKEFIAQVVILMVPLGTETQGVTHNETRMITQCIRVRHNMEDTYTDELQKEVLRRRREDEAKREKEARAIKLPQAQEPAKPDQ